MLTLLLKESNDIEQAIFGNHLNGGQSVTLFDDELPCGICRFRLESDEILLDRIGILPKYRNQKIGDFFIRAIFYKLSLANLAIVIKEVDERWLKFGFRISNNKMIVRGDEVVFPSKCGKHQ